MNYLLLSIVLFLIGLVGVLKRQNLIMFFISTEIMLNAANLAFVAISKMHNALDGQVFAIFIMAIAACEVAIGLSFCVIKYRRDKSLDFGECK
ncbi:MULTISPECIES: NADH-quinone oxidoreductase subunit NuoK [unclassified Campylobacter]|uniref:NADH-quinone oxidoreductase subunit NuoK n=1 Tax=unclassified Campylobacter TaxID=2593542 RepID=UPI001BD9B328|nr:MULTISPECIES: NADH-quinone oxidoreductase subunit NuoK [unclassified Campylobacter]MBZ7976380.1 NADH-quinone oxidoreductase subunit NuoK [Campylobacter sp. RM12637]MBZ7977936.1 NADH-quinone oxidoreductase subunit NuoK [Campylobacter sp. RM12654]MBZ7980041.1 NADH-quinone oxidoreductase subunit NuoK [Campylobacter sp. RM12642]MBZ7981856.1 NADH-quinone oxidoreductase subunit NuoK [Campylobacter sp. RM12640]MBZ7983844.1 NADH-quinone oxidoreductase subunit NuoK [Campylobacter sp. RM12647]MBZ798